MRPGRAVSTLALAGVLSAVLDAPGRPVGVEEFDATGYCVRGRTADGGRVRAGVLAADPLALPLGSIVEVKRSRLTPWGLRSGRYDGFYVVADTGGDIVGRRLDIWIADCVTARAFGHQRVMVRRVR